MKKNFRKKLLIYLFVLILIGLYVTIYVVPSVSNIFAKTIVAEYDRVQIIDEITGYIVRNEDVYFAKSSGEITYLISEGERSRKGDFVVRIRPTIAEPDEQVEKVTVKINNFSKGGNLFVADINRINSLLDEAKEQLKKVQKRNNQNDIKDAEDRVSRLMNKKLALESPQSTVISETTTNDSESIGISNENYITTLKKIAEEKLKNSGTISYYLDGYETEFTPLNMYLLNKDKVEAENIAQVNTKRDKTIANDPIFKVVKDHTWYLISWIKLESIVKYKEGSTVTVKIGEVEVVGKVDDIYEGDRDILVILKFSTYFDSLQTLRKVDASVLTLDVEGLRITNKSLTSKDGTPGVFVKGLDGKFVFKSVKVLKTDGEFCVVASGSFEQEVDGELKKVNTIVLYDEVLKNGEGYKSE